MNKIIKNIPTSGKSSFSFILNAFSLYLLNIVLIKTMANKVEYAGYISLNSWAQFVTNFSYFQIVDLVISPKGSNFKIDLLKNISILFIYVTLLISVIISLIDTNADIFFISIACFGYSIYILYSKYFIYSKNIDNLFKVRLIRSFLIILLCFLFYIISNIFLINKFYALLGNSIFTLVSIILVYKNSLLLNMKEVFKGITILKKEKIRIIDRNLTSIIEMISYPLFYQILSKTSSSLDNYIVYTIGMIYPFINIISIIIKEQVLFYKENFILNTKKHKKLISIFLIVFFAVTINFLLISNNNEIITLFIFFVLSLLTILSSSIISIIISLKGLEKKDLLICFFTSVTLLILGNFLGEINSVLLINLSMIILITKFFLQSQLALRNI